eukprot:1168569-Amorphochlora_amoeboformis.AAC.1
MLTATTWNRRIKKVVMILHMVESRSDRLGVVGLVQNLTGFRGITPSTLSQKANGVTIEESK